MDIHEERILYAAHALQGLAVASGDPMKAQGGRACEALARRALRFADAMIVERKRREAEEAALRG